MKYLAVIVIVSGMMLYSQEDGKISLNLVVGGGFNMMKSWENYPDAPDNLDDIPGAGLLGMRAEYDIGRYISLPYTFIFLGGEVPITNTGNIGIYDDTGDPVVNSSNEMQYYEYSQFTVFTELGLIKKFYTKDMGIFIGGAWVHEFMNLDKESGYNSFSESYSLSSNGFKMTAGMDYNLGKAWFFEIQTSYTLSGALMNGDNEVFSDKDEDRIFEHFPLDDVKKDEYLVPDGLSVKMGLGIRI